MQHTSPQSSYFAPILKQKLHIPKSMQSGFTGQNNCCLIWDMPCPVPGSTTTLLPLTWEAGTSPTDLFGLGHSWVQTAQEWQREATYWAPFSQRCKTWTCLILKKRWNRLAHPFEFVRVGKLIVRQGRRCGNWRAAMSSSELVTTTWHRAQGENTLCFHLRTLFCMKVIGAIVCMQSWVKWHAVCISHIQRAYKGAEPNTKRKLIGGKKSH